MPYLYSITIPRISPILLIQGKDIFKIKGGENDHVVIGNIEFKKLKDYQKGKYHTKDGDKPEIKPLPARFKVK